MIFPKVGYGRDSISGMGLILNYMAAADKKISEIASSVPKYMMIKDKIENCRYEPGQIISLLTSRFKKTKYDLSDGIKIIYRDKWVHARASNTEPIIRIIAEAKNRSEVLGLIESVKSILG